VPKVPGLILPCPYPFWVYPLFSNTYTYTHVLKIPGGTIATQKRSINHYEHADMPDSAETKTFK
jgi:hypothetical protein